MYLKESEEMIYTACTHYDMEMQNGKLGTDRVYEGSYEQAFDTVVDELEKREKEIEEMKQNKFSYEDWVMRTRISKDKIREIIYPSPDNYIPVEVQMSEMYRKIEKLVKEK